ncbi:hypothetical protein ABTA25_20200, partial [Acinetobacter baumannii]
SGPVVFAESLAPYIPVPYVTYGKDGFALVENAGDGPAFGRAAGLRLAAGLAAAPFLSCFFFLLPAALPDALSFFGPW